MRLALAVVAFAFSISSVGSQVKPEDVTPKVNYLGWFGNQRLSIITLPPCRKLVTAMPSGSDEPAILTRAARKDETADAEYVLTSGISYVRIHVIREQPCK